MCLQCWSARSITGSKEKKKNHDIRTYWISVWFYRTKVITITYNVCVHTTGADTIYSNPFIITRFSVQSKPHNVYTWFRKFCKQMEIVRWSALISDEPIVPHREHRETNGVQNRKNKQKKKINKQWTSKNYERTGSSCAHVQICGWAHCCTRNATASNNSSP